MQFLTLDQTKPNVLSVVP